MAEEETAGKRDDGEPSAGDGGGASARVRGPAKLLGGVVGLIALGAVLALMAIPSKEKERRMRGPFLIALLEEPIPINTTDSNHTRYVKFAADGEYIAYEEDYARLRAKDPFYSSYLRARIEEVTSDKDLVSVMKGLARQAFAEELRHALDPIVFPIHVGETRNPLDGDERTGLRPGLSHASATFRGYFHEHVLRLDGGARTVQLDGGQEVGFHGDEEDLRVESEAGATLFLDVTQVDEDFAGEVPVGVHGRLRKVLIHDTIAQ